MSGETLAENEYALIQAIARRPAVTQRELSIDTGLSLGMTNLLIRRLARKGYIKISQLDWKRTQYLLTPRGALEKAVKSFRYGLYTVRIFRQIRENMRTILKRELEGGRSEFAVVAQDELLDLVRESVDALELPDAKIAFHRSFKELRESDRFVLAATLEKRPADGRQIVTLVDFTDIDFRVR